jgi:hypothetical protein
VALKALKMTGGASAAGVLAWHHAAIINHPLAMKSSEANGMSGPPPDDVVSQARIDLTVALSECEEELRVRNEDPYSPLES